VGGAAVHLACMKVLAKTTKAVAHVFQVNEQDVTFKDGVFGVKNDPSKSKTLQEAALEIWYGWNLPQGMEPNLESTEFFDPPDFNYPFGAHVAVVEIDKDTCEIEVKRYIAVSDVGNACNPMIVDGQVHGGIAHGIGQVLFEEAVYDAQGALLTSDLTEYALPRATQLLNFELERTVTPTQHNSLGAKAAGEIGTLSPPPAIANAICDALSAFGVEHIDMPITPDKIWHLIR
jgi:carbon-monoxide dehydrogenase large subunit